MPYLVTMGATLHCTMGSSPSQLAPTGMGANVGGLPVATIASHVGGTHIRPFGVCTSAGNPQTAGVGSAACVPNTLAPWSAGSSSVNAGGMPVLNSNSKCQCQWGGQISVLSPGQQTVTAG